MNRWQAWAQRLRTRHGRIDAWRAPGAMVLLQRGRGAAAQAWRVHVRSSLHLHTHLAVSPLVTVSMRPAMARPLILRHAVPAGSASRRPEMFGGHAQRHVARPDEHREAATPMAAAAFVPAFRMIGPARAAPAGREPIRLSVRGGEDASPIAAHAGEMALRLRLNARREEIRPDVQAAVLAVPGRASVQPATGAAGGVEASAQSRTRLEEPRPPHPAPAVDVEALTGLVIQQIDRRLVAYRERMGRA